MSSLEKRNFSGYTMEARTPDSREAFDRAYESSQKREDQEVGESEKLKKRLAHLEEALEERRQSDRIAADANLKSNNPNDWVWTGYGWRRTHSWLRRNGYDHSDEVSHW